MSEPKQQPLDDGLKGFGIFHLKQLLNLMSCILHQVIQSCALAGRFSRRQIFKGSFKAWFSFVGKIPDGLGFHCLPTVPDFADISDSRLRSVPEFPDHEFHGT